jgi:hypothetical protein
VIRHRHPGKIHSHNPEIEGLVPHNCCPDCPDLHSTAERPPARVTEAAKKIHEEYRVDP